MHIRLEVERVVVRYATIRLWNDEPQLWDKQRSDNFSSLSLKPINISYLSVLNLLSWFRFKLLNLLPLKIYCYENCFRVLKACWLIFKARSTLKEVLIKQITKHVYRAEQILCIKSRNNNLEPRIIFRIHFVRHKSTFSLIINFIINSTSISWTHVHHFYSVVEKKVPSFSWSTQRNLSTRPHFNRIV